MQGDKNSLLGSWTCVKCGKKHDVPKGACPSCKAVSVFVQTNPALVLMVSQRSGYPFIVSYDDLLRVIPTNPTEFSLAPSFNPELIGRVTKEGFFPMTIDFGVPVFAIKLHHQRCIAKPPGKFHKSIRKRAKKFSVSVNTCWERVVELIRSKHGHCWLVPQLADSLQYIMNHEEEFPHMRMLTWEVWAGESDELVAVELGYVVGSVYTSMTGAYEEAYSGAGMVQLAVTGQYLKRNQFDYWDFGMSMNYKEDIGGYCVPRKEWLNIVKETSVKPIPHNDLLGKGKTSCAKYLRGE